MNFAQRNKYHAKKVTICGIDFDSKKEGMRYLLLKDMERHGEIFNLRRQVPFELLPAIYRDEVVHMKTKDKVERRLIQRAVHYVADFVYERPRTTPIEGPCGVYETVVEDTKGLRLPEYILKKKMMLALKGIEIIEI